MKVEVKKMKNNWGVIVTGERSGSGIYFQGYELAAARHVAAVLRRHVKRHSEGVVNNLELQYALEPQEGLTKQNYFAIPSIKEILRFFFCRPEC